MDERAGSSRTAVTEKIDEIVRRIVGRFDPERIILFGSHARGTADPESDADLLIVMRPKGSRRRQATEIDVALWGVGLPADIIVVTPEDIERSRNQPGTVVHSALREGKVVYERHR